jgi:uncharacterized membrane protein YedE/YeeE
MIDFLLEPWPWWFAGPAIGLVVPILLLIGGKQFGLSENLRHICAAVLPSKASFFQYDWKKAGSWNLVFVVGIILGGFLGSFFISPSDPIGISAATRSDLALLGFTDFTGLVPSGFFSWSNLLTPNGLLVFVGGGFLIGFGTRYAGGCTSGHAIMGLASLQLPSLIAVLGFFAGGLLMTHVIFPLIF